eukprot:3082654-Rhodomonas_salina.2
MGSVPGRFCGWAVHEHMGDGLVVPVAQWTRGGNPAVLITANRRCSRVGIATYLKQLSDCTSASVTPSRLVRTCPKREWCM